MPLDGLGSVKEPKINNFVTPEITGNENKKIEGKKGQEFTTTPVEEIGGAKNKKETSQTSEDISSKKDKFQSIQDRGLENTGAVTDTKTDIKKGFESIQSTSISQTSGISQIPSVVENKDPGKSFISKAFDAIKSAFGFGPPSADKLEKQSIKAELDTLKAAIPIIVPEKPKDEKSTFQKVKDAPGELIDKAGSKIKGGVESGKKEAEFYVNNTDNAQKAKQGSTAVSASLSLALNIANEATKAIGQIVLAPVTLALNVASTIKSAFNLGEAVQLKKRVDEFEKDPSKALIGSLEKEKSKILEANPKGLNDEQKTQIKQLDKAIEQIKGGKLENSNTSDVVKRVADNQGLAVKTASFLKDTASVTVGALAVAALAGAALSGVGLLAAAGAVALAGAGLLINKAVNFFQNRSEVKEIKDQLKDVGKLKEELQKAPDSPDKTAKLEKLQNLEDKLNLRLIQKSPTAAKEAFLKDINSDNIATRTIAVETAKTVFGLNDKAIEGLQFKLNNPGKKDEDLVSKKNDAMKTLAPIFR